MDLNQIQITFNEKKKIEYIINELPNVSGDSNININEKIKLYLNIKATQIIKYHNKYLDFNINNINVNSNKNIFMLTTLPRYVFMVAYTISHTNHPYLIYLNLDDKIINVLIPIGKEYQQANTQDYINVINSITINKSRETIKKNIKNKALLSAIYILIKNTINTRAYGIQYSKFTILTCENMTLCMHKINDISKMQMPDNEKQKLYIQYHDYYVKSGIELLQKYFYLLEKKEYSEAYDFLKGGTTKFNKYYGKTRLNTFFKNEKIIMGHLEVFISLYELLHMVVIKIER
jgi:hypothetical protein